MRKLIFERDKTRIGKALAKKQELHIGIKEGCLQYGVN